jgi:hypothetical protein
MQAKFTTGGFYWELTNALRSILDINAWSIQNTNQYISRNREFINSKYEITSHKLHSFDVEDTEKKIPVLEF